jgi:hypothetical protein
MKTDFPTCECGSQDFDRITREVVTHSLTWEDGLSSVKETNVECHEAHIECGKCNKIMFDEEQSIEEYFW